MPANVSQTHKNLSVVRKEAWRWDYPQSSTSPQGLGQGLSYVIQTDLCTQLLPTFREDSAYGVISFSQFVSCTDILDAIHRGFKTWEDNSAVIKFNDLSGSAGCESPDPKAPTEQCPWEVYIAPYSEQHKNDANLMSLAAFVTHERASMFRAGQWKPAEWDSNKVHMPSGEVDPFTDQFFSSQIRFNPGICWYLDATFCYAFHEWDGRGIPVQMLTQLLCIIFFALSVFYIIWVITLLFDAVLCNGSLSSRVSRGSSRASSRGSSFSRSRSRTRSRGNSRSPPLSPAVRPNPGLASPTLKGRDPGTKSQDTKRKMSASRCADTIGDLSISPISAAIAVFFTVFCPLFYFQIFMPCYECYDFEAAAAHELGHVLGFGHPNEEPGSNLEANGNCLGGARSPECLNPFASCTKFQAYDPAALANANRSVMESFTYSSPTTCLAPTDLTGLHALYPTCEGLEPLQASCTKAQRLSGWFRLLTVVLAPTLLAALAVLLPLHFIRRRDRRRMSKLSRSNNELRRSLEVTRKTLQEAMNSRSANNGRPPSAAQRARQAASAAAGALVGGARRLISRGGDSGTRPAPMHAAAGRGRAGDQNGPSQLMVIEELDGEISQLPPTQTFAQRTSPTLDSNIGALNKPKSFQNNSVTPPALKLPAAQQRSARSIDRSKSPMHIEQTTDILAEALSKLHSAPTSTCSKSGGGGVQAGIQRGLGTFGAKPQAAAASITAASYNQPALDVESMQLVAKQRRLQAATGASLVAAGNAAGSSRDTSANKRSNGNVGPRFGGSVKPTRVVPG